MKKLLCAFAVSWFISGFAIAGQTTQPVGVDDLWEAIDVNNHAAVEVALSNAQLRFHSGADDQNHIRDLHQIFYTNSPQVSEFVDGWLEEFPDSIHANTAKSQVLGHTSWIIRGPEFAKHIYPQALREFHQMQHEAWEYAYKAFRADKSFRPATDSLLHLVNGTGQDIQGYLILEYVMSNDPNMTSLSIGLSQAIPGWGGTWKKAERMCEHYGAEIDWEQGDPVTYCKLSASAYFMNEQRPWVEKKLFTGKYPDHEYLLISAIVHGHSTRPEADFTYRYLTREGNIDYENAKQFDYNLAKMYDYPFVSEDITRRAQEVAREKLKRDPYNPKHLNTLLTLVSHFTVMENGGLRSKKVGGPTREEEQEYRRRLLVAQPYEPDHWRAYFQASFPALDPNFLGMGDAFLTNAIVFDNHSTGALFDYSFNKWSLLNSLESLESETEKERFKALPLERQIRARKEIEGWIAARDGIDMDTQLRCPMMRAYRLFLHFCEHSKDYSCTDTWQQQEMLEIVRKNVTDRRVCTGEMSSPIQELFYSPIPVDLSPPDG